MSTTSVSSPSWFRPATVSAAAAVLVASTSALVLAGWWLNLAVLKTVFPGLPPMAPNTAAALGLAGLGLGIVRNDALSLRARCLAALCSAAVALVGTLTVIEYVLSRDIGIDRLLTQNAGRPAFQTGLVLILLGLALGSLACWPQRLRHPSHLLAVLAALPALLAVIGYACGVPSFYGVMPSLSNTGMVLHTVVLVGLLVTGILCARPDSGLMAILLSPGPGGVVARRLLLAPVVVPLTLGWLRLAGQYLGLFSSDLASWLFSLSNISVFTLVIWWSANALHRSDAQRERAERRLRAVAETATLAILSADSHSRIAYFNPAAVRMFGYPAAEAIGQPLTLLIPERFHADHLKGFARLLEGGESRTPGRIVEVIGKRRDGPELSLELSIASWRVGDEVYFTGILRDITERKQAEEEIRRLHGDLERRVLARTADLAEANRDLAEKNRENEMFVYSVSHDLRSPLVNLEGFSQELTNVGEELRGLLSESEVPDAVRQRGLALLDGDMRESTHFIRTAVRRLAEIINALLRLSRAGRVEYRLGTVDLNLVVRRVVDAMHGTIEARGATLTVHALPAAWGDAVALEQVFANLLGNALNYLDPGRPGCVEVGPCSDAQANPTGELQIYCVRDNEAGIPPDCLSKVFQPFQRLHTQAGPGEGLGLAIVRRIVERHRGRAWVESAPGKGSTFFVALPKGPQTRRAE